MFTEFLGITKLKNSGNILVKSASFYLELLHRYGDLNFATFWATLYILQPVVGQWVRHLSDDGQLHLP